MDNEFYRYNKPGLSSFADNPKKGADSIRQLLNEAKQVIPHHRWHSTPLVLKATAGLRLLPAEKADKILDEVTLSPSRTWATNNFGNINPISAN